MGNQRPAVRQADYGLGAVPWQLKLSQWFRGQEPESLCGSAFVSMVKPAHLGHGNNPSPLGRFNRSSVRRVLPKRKMTTRTVIVVQVAGHLPPERRFIHHDDVIQAFARMEPISRSTYGLCHGERGAVSTSVISISAASVRKASPYTRSRSRSM